MENCLPRGCQEKWKTVDSSKVSWWSWNWRSSRWNIECFGCFPWLQTEVWLNFRLGRNATLAKISKKYWWKGMKKDVNEYVSCCEPCQESKPINEKTPIQSILAEKPLEHIEYDLTSMFSFIDFFVLFPHTNLNHFHLLEMPKDPSKNSEWILTCIDAFSKYAWCFPLATKESSKIVGNWCLFETLSIPFQTLIIFFSFSLSQIVSTTRRTCCEVPFR